MHFKKKTGMVVVSAAAGISFLFAGGVYALLNATATPASPQAVTSGTLKLELANSGAGFSTPISDIAPTDVVNRYVDLSNTGTLDAVTQTLTVAGSGSTLLTTSATKGLQVSVSKCSVAWNTTTGVCTGTSSVIVASAPLSTLAGTPQTLQAAIPAADISHLKFAITLPDQTETTTNGVLPGGTIQGLSTNLTWTFNETQRAGVTSNS